MLASWASLVFVLGLSWDIDFSFFCRGNLVCFEERFWEVVVAGCLFCDFYCCLEGDHVSDADVDWLVFRVDFEFGADGFAVVGYEGYFLLGFLDLSDELVFCYAYGGFLEYEVEVACESTMVGVCVAVTVDQEYVWLYVQFSDALYAGLDLSEGEQSWDVWELRFAGCCLCFF